MTIVALDFETAYSQVYSLSKMSEVDYILSPMYQTLMCAIKLGDQPTEVHIGDANVGKALSEIDWDNAALLAHNMRFDGAILAWHYGHTPRLYLDTMSMAKAFTHPYVGSSSLAKVAAHMGLPPKGTEVVLALGKWFADFDLHELAAYAGYCKHDCELSRTIFDNFMAAGFPNSELAVIDLNLRMFIEPQAKLHATKLAEYLNKIRAEAAALFGQYSTIDKSVFSSNLKFAALLEEHGVAVPMKISPTTGQRTYALSKGDWAFKELCADVEQPLHIQAILATRLQVKSTIEETRTASLLNLACRDWRGRGEGWMPVPYRYFGAHTGRFSGDGGVNFANLRRGSPIRDAIEAPQGYYVVHRDASQIEARMAAWLAGCAPLNEAFAQGRDVYAEFASGFYRRPVTKSDTKERFAGKTAILSLNYGCGHVRFRHALFIGQGGVSLNLTLDEADALVRFYRASYPEIPELWKRADSTLRLMMAGYDYYDENREPLPVVSYDTDVVWLPNGMPLQYPHLRQILDTEGQREIVYDTPPTGRKKLYGAKLIENICQALARIVVTDIALRVRYETGFRPFMGTYDSWDYLIPESETREFSDELERQFTLEPTWAPGLPLASEGGWGRTLLEAEKGVNP